MAFLIFAGSFAVASTVFAMLFEKAERRWELPLWLAYVVFLAAVIAWLNFFASVMEVFE